MEIKDLNTESQEGKLLYAAICMLRASGPESVRGQDVRVIISELETAVHALESVKM